MAAGSERGGMLVEALAALTVFSIGVLGSVALMAQIVRHVQDSHCRSEAVHLAQALLARMWAEDPASLAGRYDAGVGGSGYTAFSGAASRLPGATRDTNAPAVRVEPGPTPGSRKVTISLYWQLPGETGAHRYLTTAVVGGN
jgi:type IV pilus assembly protein PilV